MTNLKQISYEKTGISNLYILSITAVWLAQKNEIGLKVGYSTIDPSDYESGAMVGLNYTYYFSNNFGLGATVNGFAYKVKGLEDN